MARLINRVQLALSDDLYGGDPRGLLRSLGLEGRSLGNGRWTVWPQSDTSFIRCRVLADRSGLPHSFDQLQEMPPPPVRLDGPDDQQRFSDLAAQLSARMRSGADLTAPLHHIQLEVMRAANNEQLIGAARVAYENIGNWPIEETSEPAFPNSTAHLISATDLLIRRARLPAIMFRLDQDPEFMKNIPALDDAAGAFATSTEWYHEIIGVRLYLGPLLGCLSPGFWCLPAARPPFVILFSLGRQIAGLRNAPMEPMQLLPSVPRLEVTSLLPLGSSACHRAIQWWSVRLNQMFTYLTDPTTFANKHGVYDPYEHQHWLLTVSQIFGLTTALQTSARNQAVQRALTYTLLDTFSDRINLGKFEQLCTYEYARACAERVRTLMPPDAADVLMPGADRAVESLRQLQDGFFIRKQRRDANVLVRIPENPQPQHREPHRAAAILLKVLRNATHGFGGIRANPSGEKERVAERLLTLHTGELPTDLVLLPYLYLLDMLSSPDRVRATILKRAQTRE